MAAIGIIDYQMGNLASLINSVEKVGFQAEVIRDPDALKRFEKLILPGVGAFGDAADHLKESGLDEAIKAHVAAGKWLFGICLGMQMLFKSSEESPGKTGLSLLPGSVKRFDPARAAHPIKIPHMGWNRLRLHHHSPLFNGTREGERLYFVHAYHAECDAAQMIASCFYGYEFAAAVQHDNLLGLQPHPEKSHTAGLKILKNFAELK